MALVPSELGPTLRTNENAARFDNSLQDFLGLDLTQSVIRFIPM